MSNQNLANPSQHASSTGQAFTGSGWLDAHFESSRPEYTAMLRSVPFEPGWHVLDAGCGSGSYLPFLAELIGPSGRITAVDLAPDNIAIVQQRVASWSLPVPIQVQVGTLINLPYPAGHFNAIWCSNTSQYLSDAELATALQEFRRMVRPGGLVAIKDVDSTTIRCEPTPPSFMQRFRDERWRTAPTLGFREPGSHRGPTLGTWLREAGFAQVWGKSTLIERSAPLRPVEQRFYRDALRSFAGQALPLDLPATDLALWRELSDPAGAASFVAQPAFYRRAVQMVAVGRVA